MTHRANSEKCMMKGGELKLNIKKTIASSIAIVGLMAAMTFPALADNADNGNADLVHVGLNPTACVGPFTGTDNGVVTVHNNFQKNSSMVNVSVHDALPNQMYVVDIRCVGQIGTLTTNSQGTGTAQIQMPKTVPGMFYIDISVLGGGGGAGGYGDTFIAGPYMLN